MLERLIIEEDLVINVYDPAKQELIVTYETRSDAAKLLGIMKGVLVHAIQRKRKFFSPLLNLEVCVREKKKLKEMKFRNGILIIQKCPS